MCSGRVDLSFILRAFVNAMDGVFIGGCHLNECHYITDGNHHAMSTVQICRKLLKYIGIDPDRLRIDELSAGEGIRFAEIMNDFSRRLLKIGPLGSEGMDRTHLKFRLEAAARLVPYIRLLERERLRVRFNTAAEYEQYFESEEAGRLFHELIGEKLMLNEIMELLRENPRSSGDICAALGLDAPAASRYLNETVRQGLVRFDEKQKRFATDFTEES